MGVTMIKTAFWVKVEIFLDEEADRLRLDWELFEVGFDHRFLRKPALPRANRVNRFLRRPCRIDDNSTVRQLRPAQQPKAENQRRKTRP